MPDVSPVYHLYLAFVDTQSPIGRDEFIYRLHQEYGIKCGIHYIPLVYSKAFKDRGHTSTECEVACERWERLVTIPCHPRMEHEHLEYLVDSIKAVLA
jgi:dTDP-4-amino-4,6-dideoxygalactose transaminase